MYSIVLVEDEKSIRENIQKGTLWEKNGFYIVGVAASVEEALEMARLLTTKEDVIIAFGSLSYLGRLMRIVEAGKVSKRKGPKGMKWDD